MNFRYVGCDIDRFVTVIDELVSDTPLSISDFKNHLSAQKVVRRA
jgi:hypothetical protein